MRSHLKQTVLEGEQKSSQISELVQRNMRERKNLALHPKIWNHGFHSLWFTLESILNRITGFHMSEYLHFVQAVIIKWKKWMSDEWKFLSSGLASPGGDNIKKRDTRMVNCGGDLFLFLKLFEGQQCSLQLHWLLISFFQGWCAIIRMEDTG